MIALLYISLDKSMGSIEMKQTNKWYYRQAVVTAALLSAKSIFLSMEWSSLGADAMLLESQTHKHNCTRSVQHKMDNPGHMKTHVPCCPVLLCVYVQYRTVQMYLLRIHPVTLENKSLPVKHTCDIHVTPPLNTVQRRDMCRLLVLWTPLQHTEM